MNRRGFLASIAAIVAGVALSREVEPPAPALPPSEDELFADISRSTYPMWDATTSQPGKPLSMADIERAKRAIWESHDVHLQAHYAFYKRSPFRNRS